jgi:hypothetical protein
MPVRGRGIDLDTLYFARASITAAVNTTATSSGTSTTLLSTGAFTLEGPTNCLIEVFAASITKGTTNIDIELFDGSTFIQSLSGHLAASVALPGAQLSAITLLSGGSHTLNVKGFVDAGTGTLGAGTGATGQSPPSTILVSPV